MIAATFLAAQRNQAAPGSLHARVRQETRARTHKAQRLMGNAEI